MDFSIREAKHNDYEEICEIIAEVDALHRQALPQVYRKPEGPVRTKEYISNIIENEDAALFVAEVDGQVVGLVHISIQEVPNIPIMVPRRYAFIENLAVKKKFRRCGVGKLLVEKAHHWALDKGIIQVKLHSWEFNQEAISFYNKLGYRTVSREMWKSLR